MTMLPTEHVRCCIDTDIFLYETRSTIKYFFLAAASDCRSTVSGLDYVGHVNTTASGRTCMSWSAQEVDTFAIYSLLLRSESHLTVTECV